MPTFQIVTEEILTGLYDVEASSPDEALQLYHAGHTGLDRGGEVVSITPVVIVNKDTNEETAL